MEIAGIGLLSAFIAGLISFLSPCVLPLVPGYLSYVTGQSVDVMRSESDARVRASALALSVLFVLGFSTIFIALGASASAIGQLLLRYRYETNILGGGIVTVFGLFMMGVLRIQWLLRDVRFHARVPRGARPAAAYVLGLSFAFGWTPCIGPVLGAILTVSATTLTVGDGVALLSVYSLGLGAPFLAAALFAGSFVERLRTMGKIGARLQIAAGLLLVVMGVAMMTGQLTTFAWWLLRTFPILQTIG
jgi:cytochrome c-type biogenesis protein